MLHNSRLLAKTVPLWALFIVRNIQLDQHAGWICVSGAGSVILHIYILTCFTEIHNLVSSCLLLVCSTITQVIVGQYVYPGQLDFRDPVRKPFI